MKTMIIYFCGTGLGPEDHRYGEIISNLAKNTIPDDDTFCSAIYAGLGSQESMSMDKATEAMFGNHFNLSVDDAAKRILDDDSIGRVIMVGYSRGAAQCLMLANQLAEKNPSIDTALITLDLVPGPWNFQDNKVSVPATASNYYGIYAQNEPIIALRPIFPRFEGETCVKFMTMPGNHMTVANLMKTPSVNNLFAKRQDEKLPEVGLIIRDTIEKQIRQLTGREVLNNTLNLSELDLLEAYQTIKKCPRNIMRDFQPFIPAISDYKKRMVYDAERRQLIPLQAHPQLTPPKKYVNHHHKTLVKQLRNNKILPDEFDDLLSSIEAHNSEEFNQCLNTMSEPHESYRRLLNYHHCFNRGELQFIINTGGENQWNDLETVQMAYQAQDHRVLKALFNTESPNISSLLGDGREGDKTAEKDLSNKLSASKLNDLVNTLDTPEEQLALLERLFCYLAQGQSLALYTRTSGAYVLPFLAKRDDNISLSQTQKDHIALLQSLASSICANNEESAMRDYQNNSLLLNFDNTHYQLFCRSTQKSEVSSSTIQL